MKLLVTGNIGYITTEFIKEAFPECQILLLGETALKSDRRKGISVHPMPHAEKEFEDIFKTYEFEGVIYFSNYLTFPLVTGKSQVFTIIFFFQFFS